MTSRLAGDISLPLERMRWLDAVASAHGPILRGDRIVREFAATAKLAGQPIMPTPDQSVLEQLLTAASADSRAAA